ncbi:cutinase family protein [Aestuariimicrobium soli]|uniref:cutinase family protein n=1 Tax=Aestuariimicrobium soli TaxID=2035834 RepID=UPI003EBB4363
MSLHRSSALGRLLVAAVATALALVGAVVRPTPAAAAPEAWSGTPVASSAVGDQACADFLFVGVRGSGEPAGYGPTVTRVRDGLAERWTTGSVRQVWLDYPAADPHTLTGVPMASLLLDQPMPSTEYFTSARTGATRLATLLTDQASRCPAERTILAGFSQGAQVITAALGSAPEAPARLAAAILVGNPSHYPGQSVREISGSASQNAIGLGAMLYLLREQARRGGQTDRDQAVRTLIQTTINLYQGTFDVADIRAAMVAQHAEIPPLAYQSTYSVCQAGDLVCDAGQSMAQVMVQATTLSAEIDRTRPIHSGYTPEVLAPTIEAASTAIAALPPIAAPPASASSEPSSAARPQPTVQVTVDRQWWLVGVAVAAALPLLVVAFALGHRAGRRPSRPRRPVAGASASSADSPRSPVTASSSPDHRESSEPLPNGTPRA